MNRQLSGGFTLIELIVTLTIMAILASVIIPITDLSIKRSKEQELRLALKEIRTAIDAYKLAGDQGRIYRNAETTGYPKTLNELVDGIVDMNDPKGQKIYFLRRIPIDPMYPTQTISSEITWGIRSYRSDPKNIQYMGDVYDVYSLSNETGLNGRAYKDW